MNLEFVMLSEVSQTEKDNYHVVSYIYLRSKNIIQMILSTNQKFSHRCRKQAYGYQVGRGVVIARLGLTYKHYYI